MQKPTNCLIKLCALFRQALSKPKENQEKDVEETGWQTKLGPEFGSPLNFKSSASKPQVHHSSQSNN